MSACDEYDLGPKFSKPADHARASTCTVTSAHDGRRLRFGVHGNLQPPLCQQRVAGIHTSTPPLHESRRPSRFSPTMDEYRAFKSIPFRNLRPTRPQSSTWTMPPHSLRARHGACWALRFAAEPGAAVKANIKQMTIHGTRRSRIAVGSTQSALDGRRA
jgi:hypothetical protein